MKKWSKIKLYLQNDPTTAVAMVGLFALIAGIVAIFITGKSVDKTDKNNVNKEFLAKISQSVMDDSSKDKGNNTIEVSAQVRELPVYCVDTDEKKIALSFDAAWGDEYTDRILEILKQKDVKATFFLTGQWLKDYPQKVVEIYNAGHELGNHSLNHKEMSKLSEKDIKEEIMGVHIQIKELTGYDANVFRPPYGDYNNKVILGAKSCGYMPVQWSVDSLDWKDYGASSIIDTVTNHKALDNGAIILMHNGAKYTADALENVIDLLKEQGYEFVTVGELIYRDNYTIDHTGKQILSENDSLY